MSTENCSRVLSLISINKKETPAKASSTTCQISSFDNEQGTLRHWHRSGSVKLVESKVFLIICLAVLYVAEEKIFSGVVSSLVSDYLFSEGERRTPATIAYSLAVYWIQNQGSKSVPDSTDYVQRRRNGCIGLARKIAGC